MEAMPQMEAAPPETGPDVVEAGSDVCVPDANLMSIPVPDAALNEAGATAAGCVACLNTSCPMLVAECNQSCACIAAVEAFATCIASGTASFQICAASNLLNLSSTGVDASIFCAAGCAPACGVMLPTDGGPGDSGPPMPDGGGDASGD